MNSGLDGLETIAAYLNALYCGALLIDRAGRIVHLNERFEEMLQRRREHVKGMLLAELYAGTGERGEAVVRAALEHFDESREREFFLPRADGTELAVIVSGRPLRIEDMPGEAPDAAETGHEKHAAGEHRIITVIDISPQKKIEQDLQERYAHIATLSDTVLEQALELKRYGRQLEQRVRDRTQELHRANMEAITMLAVASEAKDTDTGAHVARIEHYVRLLAREMGMSEAESERMGYSAILHDVGKIQVPDHILQKPAALTDEEWTVMRGHTLAGERILSREPFFELARSIARHHHEDWNGGGYPDGLAGNGIPAAARIVRVADVFDALTSARPYKPAWTTERAAAEIAEGAGQQFDPAVVQAFLTLVKAGRFVTPGAGQRG